MTTRLRWLPDLALAALLLATGRALLGSFASYAATHDLDYFDDSEYQNDGLRGAAGGRAAEWAPLYRLWAMLLHLLTHDSLQVFHLNAYLLALAVPLLLYALLRAYEVWPVLSFSAASAWLICAANLDVGPRVAQFGLLPMLAGLIVARAVRSDPWRWSWLCGCALVCSYVRPEFFYSLLLMLLVAIWWALGRRQIRPWLKAMAVPLAALLVIAALGQLPIGGARATMALKQHVVLSLMAWNGQTGMEAWQSSAKLLAAYPSLDRGLLSFAIHDTGVFVHHLMTNAALLFSSRATDGLRPAELLLDQAPWLSLLAILLPLAMAGPLVRAQWPAAPAHRDAALAMTIYALPSILLCFVVYPRPHYLQLPLLALMFLVMLATGRRQGGYPAALVLAAGMLALACLGVRSAEPAPTPRQDTVRHLRGQALPVGFRMFDDSGLLRFHLPGAGRSFQRYEVRAPLAEWLVANRVDLVVITGRGERGDPSWAAFLEAPERAGYSCSWFAPGERTLCRAIGPKPG